VDGSRRCRRRLGHAFPIFLKFQGGKAVASFVGVALALAPLALLAVVIVFVLVVARTRFISLGSILGAALFPSPSGCSITRRGR